MAIDSLKVRADALRAEAKSARAEVSATYQARLTDIDTESSRVRRDTRTAEQSATQATEEASGMAAGARVDYRSAVELEQSAAAAAKRGDTRQAEEDTELAAHARGSAKRYEQQEREATLEAAKHREEAAGHDRRATELQYEARDTNQLNNAAEKQLDNLEERARLYEEAIRKFDESDGPVNAPKRARLQREADEAIAKADAIEVDRAAIRVLAPKFPEQTPGFDTTVSSATPADEDGDPTALAFGGEANAGDGIATETDTGTESEDLGLDQDGTVDQSTDPLVPESEPSAVVASTDDAFATEPPAGAEEFAFDTPEPAFAGVDAASASSEGTDTFAESDFASADEPVEALGGDSDTSFSETDFA